MARPKRINDLPEVRPDDILSQIPSVECLEQRLAELELEAERVRTLLAAVRQMSGSRQTMAGFEALDEIDETA